MKFNRRGLCDICVPCLSLNRTRNEINKLSNLRIEEMQSDQTPMSSSCQECIGGWSVRIRTKRVESLGSFRRLASSAFFFRPSFPRLADRNRRRKKNLQKICCRVLSPMLSPKNVSREERRRIRMSQRHSNGTTNDASSQSRRRAMKQSCRESATRRMANLSRSAVVSMSRARTRRAHDDRCVCAQRCRRSSSSEIRRRPMSHRASGCDAST